MLPDVLSPADCLIPEWQVSGAQGLMTTRRGGISQTPFDSMNLRPQVGDDAAAVAHNRQRLSQTIATAPVYLDQVHSARVVRLTATDAEPGAAQHTADASITTEFGLACTAQVADCLPALFVAPGVVGAAHAGWRGLAGGVLEATLMALCEASACAPADVQVWLGACIGPRRFEVGADVVSAFGIDPGAGETPDPQRFVPHTPGKWLANLPQLARDRLARAGVTAVSGGVWCTVEDASRFFSYRRDRVTGRMVAAVWRTH